MWAAIAEVQERYNLPSDAFAIVSRSKRYAHTCTF